MLFRSQRCTMCLDEKPLSFKKKKENLYRVHVFENDTSDSCIKTNVTTSKSIHHKMI